MFKKNLKSLSLFLILLVLMIGAIGAVSATDYDGGNSDITISDASDINVTQATADLDTAASEANAVEVTIVTDGLSTKSYEGTYVPDATPIVSDGIKFDTSVYSSDDEESAIPGVVVDDTTALTDAGDGVFKGTLSITDGATALTSGETYYLGIIVPATATATYAIDETNNIVSTVGEETTLFVPFTYVSLYEVVIVDEPEEIDFEDVISYNGTVIENTETEIPATATISVTFTNVEDDSEYTIDETDIDFLEGIFVIDDVETVLDKDDTPVSLPAGAYHVVVELYDDTDPTIVYAYTETILLVNGINVTLAAELDEDTAAFDDPSTLAVAFDEEFEALDLPTVIVTAINQATGVSYVIDALDYDAEDEVFEGEMTIDDGDELPVGTYLVTVSAAKANYEFNSVALTYTVEAAETEIDADPNPVYVVDDEDATIEFAVLTEATPLGIDVADGTITAVLRDEDGNAVKALEVDYTEDLVTVDADDVEDGYYVSLSYVDPTGNYEASSVNVPLYIRKGTKLTVDPATAEFNYGQEGPVVTITLTDKPATGAEAKTLKLNTTLSISVNDVPIDTVVTLVDGVGKFNLTDLGLDADDEPQVVTFSYVDEEDEYMPAEADLPVMVYAVQSYILNTNVTKPIFYTISSDDVIGFNLTLASNSSAIAPYNGNLTYYPNAGEEDYTIPVVNGIASIPVADLADLAYNADEDPIVYTFFVEGNEVSNEVQVIVIVQKEEGEIIAENITTYNNTPVTVEGTVTNTTGGKVAVAIMTDPEDPTSVVATVSADVAEDGSFAASFGTLPDGEYYAGIVYNGASADFPADVDPILISINVNGTSPGPEPVTNTTYATVLTIEPFNETEGAGKSLVGKLALEDGTPVIGMHILLNLTRVSDGASKVYTTTTDYNGEFQFPINLGAGEYTAYATFEGVTIPSTNVTYNASESPVTPFSVTKNGTQPTNETSVIITTSPYVGTYGTVGNFTAKFTNNAGQPLVGYPVGTIEVTLTRVSSGASKTYSYFVTDYNGEITMPIELAPGQYTADIKFKGSTVPAHYDPAETSTTLTVNRA